LTIFIGTFLLISDSALQITRRMPPVPGVRSDRRRRTRWASEFRTATTFWVISAWQPFLAEHGFWVTKRSMRVSDSFTPEDGALKGLTD
jgi:hypothetical protein